MNDVEPIKADPIIEIKGLEFARGDRKIFDGVDISIRRGEIVAIMGPSGTGKTTLLQLILGQIRPDKGEVLVNGRPVHSMSRRELFKSRESIGVLFQSGALLTDLSAAENVALPMEEHTDLPKELIDNLVNLKLEAVGLRGAGHLMPAELSGGMKRRIALARAVALDPELILYDEPFAGLDPIAYGAIRTLVHDLGEALGLTSVLVTHHLDVLSSIADRVFIVADAKIIGHGKPEEILASDSPMIRQFLDGMPDGPVPFHAPAEPIAKSFGLS